MTVIEFSSKGGVLVTVDDKPIHSGDWIWHYLYKLEDQGIEIDGARVVMHKSAIMADVKRTENETSTTFFI